MNEKKKCFGKYDERSFTSMKCLLCVQEYDCIKLTEEKKKKRS
nr:MAG: hypothetical protein [Helarchaeota virus Nidhogg Meg22_1012]